MNDTMELIESVLQADLEAADMWSGIDDRGFPTAVYVLFDSTVTADPKAVMTSQSEADFALTLANLLRPANTPRWHLVRVLVDFDLANGGEVWVDSDYMSYDAPPANVRVTERKPERAGVDCYTVRVVEVERDDLPS